MLISGFLQNQSMWKSWASTHALLYQLERSATCPLQEGIHSPDGSPVISLLYYLSLGFCIYNSCRRHLVNYLRIEILDSVNIARQLNAH